MRHYGLIYEDNKQLKKFIDELNVEDSSRVLIQVFTGVIDLGFIKNITHELISNLPKAEIIGLTSAGEIFEGKILSESTVLSFTIFEDVNIKTILMQNDDNETEIGNRIYQELVNEDTKLVILFTDGLVSDGGDIVRALQSYNKDLKICGAKAGDCGLLRNTYVFTKEGVLSVGVAAVSLSSSEISVTIQSSFCWSSIGKTMKITKAHKNRIYTIDNISAVEVYKKYLGIDIEHDLTVKTTEFPLIIKKDGVDIARVAYKAYEDGSLDFYGNVSVGDEVQFGYGNVNMITKNSLEIIESFSKKPVDLIFIYSCYVRKTFLGKNISIEVEPLNDIAPTYGLFTYGEFFSNNSCNPLFNVTMLIVGITENKKNIRQVKEMKNSYKLISSENDLRIIKTFSNLANQVIQELQEANILLKNQKKMLERLQNASNSVLDINNRIISYSGDDTIFNTILDKIIELIPSAQFGSILFVKNKLNYYSTNSGQFEKYMESINNYLVESDFQENYNNRISFYPVIIDLEREFYENDLSELNFAEIASESNPLELLTCNIELEDRSIAIINIFSEGENKFLLEDIPIVKHMAYEIAIIFKNAKFLEKIMYLYKYDRLTGILNRNYFVEVIHNVYEKAVIDKNRFIICMIDLDKFKEINDKFGHDVGDLYLVKFIDVLKRNIEPEDYIGRVGGDEFEILFINKTKIEVVNIIKKVCEDFEKNKFIYKEFSKVIDFSYGISEYPNDSKKIRDLIKNADEKMYESKKDKNMGNY